MTAQKGWRKLLATVTTGLLVIGGLATAPLAANADESASGPQLTVTPSTGLDKAGDTVTVTGAGYNPDQPIYLTYCEDVPLEDVSFAFISEGCVRGSKQVTSTPSTATQVQFNADGSFETELEVAPRVEGQETAVYTIAAYPAMTDRSQDAKASIKFGAAVTRAAATAASGKLTVNVDAVRLPDGVEELYGALIVKDSESSMVGGRDGFAAFAIPFPTVTDGSASFTLTAKAADLDRTQQYEVLLWAKHANPTPENIYARADVAVSSAQWDTVFASTTTAKVSFTPTTFAYNVAKTATVKVTAANGATPTGTVTVTINSKKYTKKLSGGKASIKLTKPANVSSKRAVSVVYTSNSSKFLDSKKATTYVKITKAKPSLSVKLNKSKVSTKQKAKAAISVKVPGSLGATAKGLKVTVYDGSKKLKTAKLNSKGKVNVTIPKLKKGTHKIKVNFSGSSNISSKTKTVTLKVK